MGGGGGIPEEEGVMDKILGFFSGGGGEISAGGGMSESSSRDKSPLSAISGLLSMGQYRANKPKPRERMELINNKYIQGLMRG